jgi:hypothetical protein
MFYSRRAIFKLKKFLRIFVVSTLIINWKKEKCQTRASYADGRQRWPVDILRGGGHQGLLTSLMTAALIIIIVKRNV